MHNCARCENTKRIYASQMLQLWTGLERSDLLVHLVSKKHVSQQLQLLSAIMTALRQPQSDVLPLDHPMYSAQLFRTSLFSDCTIYSKHRVWHLHRCILSPRCEFFWKCFQGSFEEASSASVEMHDDDAETLERLLIWIYQLQYPALAEQAQRGTAWTKDLMLYMMADKYGLSALMDTTKQALMQLAAQCLNQSDILVRSADDFVEVMQMLYMDLPEREDLVALRIDLLATLSPVLAKHVRSISCLEELMTTTPGFSVDLVESLARQRCDRRWSSSSSSGSLSVGSGSSSPGSTAHSPRNAKPYIPLNEDSEDELE